MTREEAIAVAKEIADDKGWRWEEPVRAWQGRRWHWVGAPFWEVYTNAGRRGANVHVVVDDASRRVLLSRFLAR